MAAASSCTGAALGSRAVLQEPVSAKDTTGGQVWGVTGVITGAWDSYSQGALVALKHRHKMSILQDLWASESSPRTGDTPVTHSAGEGTGQCLTLLYS